MKQAGQFTQGGLLRQSALAKKGHWGQGPCDPVLQRRDHSPVEKFVHDITWQQGDGVGFGAQHHLHAPHGDRLHDRHRWLDARGDEDRVVEPTHRRVRRRQDPVQRRQLGPVERAAGKSLLVLRGNDQAGLLFVKGLLHDVLRITFIGAADGAIQLTLLHAGDQLIGRALGEKHRQPWSLAEQVPQRCRQEWLRHLGGDAKTDTTAMPAVDGGKHLGRRFQVGQAALGIAQHRDARRSGLEAPRRPLKQGGTEDVFHLPQGLGDRGLADAHLRSDPIERALAIDRQQQVQLAQLQAGQQGVLNGSGGVSVWHNLKVIAESENCRFSLIRPPTLSP